jgi:hypothetical protein
MAVRGKNINLFLMDGDPRGRVKVTLQNWTGVVYRIPRTDLDRCKDRDDLSQSGVYFLFGVTEDTDEDAVYVGQAGVRKNGEGILYRLIEHKRNAEKNYWTEAVIFTTSNNSFGPTEISWLEHCFTAMAVNAKRYVVKNGNEPTQGHVTEEKESELEEFVDYAKIVMGALGFKVFEPLNEVTQTREDSSTKTSDGERGLLLFLKRKSSKSGRTIEATCRQTSEGFVVLKGSQIETIDSDSIPASIKESRQKADIDDNGVLQSDMLFRSPSYAAAFVVGGHANGLRSWKTAEGRTLKDIEEKTLSELETSE